MNSTRLVAALAAFSLAAASSTAFAQDRGERGNDSNRGRGNAYGQERDHRGDNRYQNRDDRRDNRRDDGRFDRRGPGAGPEHSFYRGGRLPAEYRTRQYVVDDWRSHRLSAPPRGHRWVQSGGDYLLVAVATGVIASIVLGNR